MPNKYLKFNLSKTDRFLFSLANAFLPPPFPSQLMTTSSFQLLGPNHPGDLTNAQENHFGSIFRKYAEFNHFLPPPLTLLSSESLEWAFKNIESDPVIPPRTLQWFSIFFRIKNKELTMQGFVRSDRMTTFLKCHSSPSYLSSSQECKLLWRQESLSYFVCHQIQCPAHWRCLIGICQIWIYAFIKYFLSSSYMPYQCWIQQISVVPASKKLSWVDAHCQGYWLTWSSVYSKHLCF